MPAKNLRRALVAQKRNQKRENPVSKDFQKTSPRPNPTVPTQVSPYRHGSKEPEINSIKTR